MDNFPMLENLLTPEETPLLTALDMMDRGALGILFVVDQDGRLLGTLTDGDVRRGLLRGLTLDAPVRAAMRRRPVALPVDAPRETVLRTLSRKVKIIPLIDEARRPVDYASMARYRRIPVLEPAIGEQETTYVVECLKSGWISSRGRFVTEFEHGFAAYLGVRDAVAVSSGTAALHLALTALGVGPGDEVIVPDLTFAATANAVLHAGATPVLADVDPDTWNIDPDAAEAVATSRTRAIIPVHLYGLPADMDRLTAWARRRRLLVVEDAAEALGARHHDRPVGSLGDAAAFSFFGNKLITTGEGGMATFRDPAAADRARMLRDHGMNPERRYWHEEVGYNYRLTNLQAAVGVAQLEKIDTLLNRKRAIAAAYRDGLADIPQLRPQAEPAGLESACWAFSIVAPQEESGLSRDEAMRRLDRAGIETRPLFYPLHEMPPYRRFAAGGDFPNATRLSRGGFSLPSGATLAEREQRHVVQALRRIFSAERRGERSERAAAAEPAA